MSKTSVATKSQTEVAVPMDADLLAQLAADAKASSALERPAVGSISFRAGMVSYQGEPVKGNVLRGVIVGAAFVNAYYENKWDPDNIVNPNCFALSPDGENMVPHANVQSPISGNCTTCAFNQWNSDLKDGKPAKGKRCKEARRLVFLPESALESVEDVQAAELAMCRLPVTSVKAWGGFVNTLAATLNLPYYAVVCEITTKPDLKTQFKVVMTPVAQIQDGSILRAIIKKREEAQRIAMLPFDAAGSSEEEEAAPANTKF